MVTFPEKKNLESANMIANDIRIFVKGFNFCGCAKNYFHLKSFFFSSAKGLRVTKIVKKMKFEGVWPKLQEKNCLQRRSITKYIRLTSGFM